MQSHTKKSTRIIIWIIAIVMALGFLGSYFVTILENNNAAQQPQIEDVTSQATEEQEELEVDPNAHKVEGKVEKLEIIDHKVGDGEEVKPGDTVKVHYKGTLAATGGKFDSSYDRGEPLEFSLSGVIRGWQEGVPGMKVGGKRRLVVPAEMAYGAQAGNGIPANSDLVFEIELLGVTHAE